MDMHSGGLTSDCEREWTADQCTTRVVKHGGPTIARRRSRSGHSSACCPSVFIQFQPIVWRVSTFAVCVCACACAHGRLWLVAVHLSSCARLFLRFRLRSRHSACGFSARGQQKSAFCKPWPARAGTGAFHERARRAFVEQAERLVLALPAPPSARPVAKVEEAVRIHSIMVTAC
jgi:hypothetical protein